MVGTRRFWRTFAGTLAVVLAVSTVGAASGGEFWTTLLIGLPIAIVSAWWSTRPDAAAESADNRVAHEMPDVAPVAPDAALLGTVLETMTEGVMVVDAREHLVYANPASRSLLEIPPRLAGDRPLLEAVRSPGIEATMQAALRTGRTQQSEFPLSRRDRMVALTASPLAGQAAAGVVLVLNDVTDLRRLERLRREFVSNVSHELKTPLTHIQAYADTLADGAIDDQEHNRKFLERIIEQSERLQALIVDLLRLAQIESQEGGVDLEPIDLAAATTRSVEEHQAAARGSGVTLTVDNQGKAVVLADSAGLQQIIDNLLDNAAKYTPSGGTVSVKVSQSDDSVVLEVADTGIGIGSSRPAPSVPARCRGASWRWEITAGSSGSEPTGIAVKSRRSSP